MAIFILMLLNSPEILNLIEERDIKFGSILLENEDTKEKEEVFIQNGVPIHSIIYLPKIISKGVSISVVKREKI